jgi:hypothetical protein
VTHRGADAATLNKYLMLLAINRASSEVFVLLVNDRKKFCVPFEEFVIDAAKTRSTRALEQDMLQGMREAFAEDPDILKMMTMPGEHCNLDDFPRKAFVVSVYVGGGGDACDMRHATCDEDDDDDEDYDSDVADKASGSVVLLPISARSFVETYEYHRRDTVRVPIRKMLPRGFNGIQTKPFN